MTTTLDIAKKYDKTPEEIKSALTTLGYAKGITRVSKVDPDMERALDGFFKDQEAPKAKAAARPSNRRIGDTQITEKKVRTINRPQKTPAPAAAQTAPEKTAAETETATPRPDSSAVVAADELHKKQIAAQKEKVAAPKKPAALKKPEKTPAAQISQTAQTPQTATATEERKSKTIKIDKKVIREREKRRRRGMIGGKRPPENLHGFKQPAGPVVRELPLPEAISVARLADEMAVKVGVIIRKLMEYGMEDANANMLLDRKTAWVLVEEFGHKPVHQMEEEDAEAKMLAQQASDAEQSARPPVVTIMGHVDHGKTSLLDHIRKTRVAAGEAGGITQHIGAYQVKRDAGDITFLDTPGHALFSQMRARGAQITDIVVLVVAGDDGVKPQTEEAISHAQDAGVPIVVAVNKKDKPDFDMERIKSELSARGVTPEDWGGDAIVVAISAHTGEGIDALLDAICIQRDILELKAAYDTSAQGAVVEARMDRGRGALTTIIIRQGVLRRGDCIVCGTESGRVRAMWDGAGAMLEEAGPSMPVEIQGLSGLPEVGADLIAVADERRAREVAGLRQERHRTKVLSARMAARPVSLLLSDKESEEEKRELNVIVKADVGGSREALVAALSSVSGKKAAIKVIHSAVGGVNESDINLARAGNALIIAFNVRPDGKSRRLAQSCGIKILYGNVIYEILESAKQAVLDLLSPEREEQVIGSAEVLKVFPIAKVGNVAGCRVSEGIIRADARARLVRDGAIVYEGDIDSLRHFKDRTEEVKSGEECGIAIRRFGDIKVADVIEAVRVVETPPTL